MYKGASRNLQRRVTRIEEARPSAAAYIGEDDLIQSAANMSKRDCESERRDLLTEKARLENELIGAKRAREYAEIGRIGHRLQSLCARLSLLRGRLHELERASEVEALKAAIKEIVPPDLLRRIYDRQRELKAEVEAGQ